MKVNAKILLWVFCSFVTLGFSYTAGAQEQQAADMPNILLIKPDKSQLFTRDIQGKSVLVLFQPDCDHCQREAVQIREHLKAFQDYTVYFISSAPLEEIEQFSEEYKLQGNPNVFFAHTDLMNILDNFGAVQTPSLYIYSKDQELVKAFNGETPIGMILPHI